MQTVPPEDTAMTRHVLPQFRHQLHKFSLPESATRGDATATARDSHVYHIARLPSSASRIASTALRCATDRWNPDHRACRTRPQSPRHRRWNV